MLLVRRDHGHGAPRMESHAEEMERLLRAHMRGEGSGPWNEHADGCFYCGAWQHHSQECPERDAHEWWEA